MQDATTETTATSYVERFETILFKALYTDEEIADESILQDAVIAEGVVTKMGFHPERLPQAKEPLRTLLREMLHDDFLRGGGGGGSFLALCNDRNGEQWTDLHRTMDALVILSIACGFARFCAPREVWRVLPSGMPYVVFDLDEDGEA